jgi:DNA replication ATP-dependent helicase Dna2
VDEASQITLPVCLGPLRYADRFVLVGDHYQLPPLVRNVEAQKGGLDVSLFKLLSESQPQAMTILEHQYRMNEDIMLLSNTLVYDGMLKCGNMDVARRILQIPDQRGMMAAKPWVRDILSERYLIQSLTVGSKLSSVIRIKCPRWKQSVEIERLMILKGH